jgi:hypothetical protein
MILQKIWVKMWWFFILKNSPKDMEPEKNVFIFQNNCQKKKKKNPKTLKIVCFKLDSYQSGKGINQENKLTLTLSHLHK